MIFKMIFKELRSSPRFFIFFIINLSLGLGGLATIEIFKSSFQGQLTEKSKELLGADLSIRSRRPIDDQVLRKIRRVLPKPFVETQNISLFSMAMGNKKSRLVSVRVIGPKFPFYGLIQLESGRPMKTPQATNAFIYPELGEQLNLKLGDEFSLGLVTFKVAGFVENDGQQSFQMGGIAPRVYISNSGLKKAKLLQTGSTAWYSVYYKLEGQSLQKTREAVAKVLNDSSIEIKTSDSSSKQIGRLLRYLNDFLGLVSLCGLFLATMGMIYLYRSFLHQRKKEMAIYYFLGMTKMQVGQIYLGELIVLGLLGSLVGTALGALMMPFLEFAINHIFEISLGLKLEFTDLLIPFFLGFLSSILIGIPFLTPYLKTDYKLLFAHGDQIKRSWSDHLLFIPGVIFYWLLAVYLSHSFFIGSLFMAPFILCAVFFLPVGSILLGKISPWGNNFPLAFKTAWKFMTRYKITTLFIYISLMISTFLMLLAPQVKDVLNAELKRPLTEGGPSLFLFDIQPEQKASISKFFKQNNLVILNTSAMIRARLLKINDQVVKTNTSDAITREQEREIRFRNRGINLSYRDGLDTSEKIIAGRLPKRNENPLFNGPFEVTLEQRYAQRLNVKIGDTLEFDVLDSSVKALVVGLRQVQWTSFVPNFFIMFGPGVLENAPKTYLSAISNPNKINLARIKKTMFDKFPNVSVIDVRRAIHKVLSIMESMSQILQIMTVIVLIAGSLVLYSIIYHQIVIRESSINLFKVLGMSFKDLKNSVFLEIFIISILATISGSLMSTIFSYLLSEKLFNSPFLLNLPLILIHIFGIPIFALLISYLGTRNILKKRPGAVFADIR
jgi:putative ABC transport system permease protein